MMPSCAAAADGEALTFTCVVVIPSTGTVVGDGVGGTGVNVAEGIGVGGSVDVIINGVAVPAPGSEMRQLQPVSHIAIVSIKMIRLSTR